MHEYLHNTMRVKVLITIRELQRRKAGIGMTREPEKLEKLERQEQSLCWYTVLAQRCTLRQ
jgi:hypothetical protein